MTHFAVTAIGEDRPGIVAALAEALQELEGNLEDVSSTILRGHFAMMLVVDAPVDAERLLRELEEAATPLGIRVSVADVEEDAAERPRATHVVTAYGSDRPGIVARLTRLLADREVNVTDLSCRLTEGPNPIYAMVAEVAVPEGTDVDVLEADLRTDADELGVDVAFGPVEAETL